MHPRAACSWGGVNVLAARAGKLICGCDTKFRATPVINNHLLYRASCFRPSAGFGISGDNSFGLKSSLELPKEKKMMGNA